MRDSAVACSERYTSWAVKMATTGVGGAADGSGGTGATGGMGGCPSGEGACGAGALPLLRALPLGTLAALFAMLAMLLEEEAPVHTSRAMARTMRQSVARNDMRNRMHLCTFVLRSKGQSFVAGKARHGELHAIHTRLAATFEIRRHCCNGLLTLAPKTIPDH